MTDTTAPRTAAGRLARVGDWLRWLARDKRDDDPDRPDWQALVDAVDLAASIATGHTVEHVIRHRAAARIIADFYYVSVLREEVDGELFALEAALATYPDDFYGREAATHRYDYIFDRAVSR